MGEESDQSGGGSRIIRAGPARYAPQLHQRPRPKMEGAATQALVCPPELAVEQPRKWWDLIATTGLGGRALEEQLKKLFEELNEILIFSPTDLAEQGKDQLDIVSDDTDSNRLPGQLWRAVKVAGGSKDLAERPCPSAYVPQGWGARQLARAISADSAKES